MVKKLEWYTDGQDKASVKGAVDGLRLFRAYQPLKGLERSSEYVLLTTLPVGPLRHGETEAMRNLISRDVAMAKAQKVLEQFAMTLDTGVIDWRESGFVRPQTGSVGGINLFTIHASGSDAVLNTTLPIDPGGVATVELATVSAAEKKAKQMLDQFADHLGIVFTTTGETAQST